MKAFVILCLTVIFAFAIGAPAPAISAEKAAWEKVVEAAKREGVVNVYTGIFSGKAGVEVSKAFKDKYGILLESTTGRARVTVEKVKMEQKSKSYVADVFEDAGAGTITLKREGYLESMAEVLPVLKEKDKFVSLPIVDPPEAQILALVLSDNNFWLNTNLVKPGEEPKSYYDLLEPKWKGKIFLSNPLFRVTPDSQVVVFVRDYKVLTEDYFIKLYKNGTLGGPAGAAEAVDKLVRGEFPIVGWVSVGTPLKAFLDGAPIKPLDFKEGTVFSPAMIAAVKNSPHPNATKVFINWLFSKEGQLVASKAVGLGGVRSDIPSVMPFRLTGPMRTVSYKTMIDAEARFSEQYLAKLLGLKK